MKLYELSNEYKNLIESLHDENGIIDEEKVIKLKENEEQFNEKCIAISSHIRNLEIEWSAIREAKIEMTLRQSRLNNQINYFKNYLVDNMSLMGLKEVKSPHFIIKLKKNPESIHVYNEALIPFHYKKEVIEHVIDKIKLKNDIQNGLKIEGASLKQNVRVEIK